MHLYIHEFDNLEDSKVKEIRDLLFKSCVNDYQARTGRKQETLEVSLAEHGKPYFSTASNMHFSISHSGRYWTCLFDHENVGLDIEDFSRKNMTTKRFIDITDRFFEADERSFVLGGDAFDNSQDDPGEEIKDRFFRIWTAKEAYMKYTGNGFSEGFKNFSVLGGTLDQYFRNVPIDPKVVLTFCSDRDTNLDELINI